MDAKIRLLPVNEYRPGLDNAFLIEENWPKGLPRQGLDAAHWLKGVAPAPGLLKWLRQDERHWSTFCEVYWADLAANPQRWWPLWKASRRGGLALLYVPQEGERQPAQALAQFLGDKLDEIERIEAGELASPVCYRALLDH
jgi:uncharacterized protein YeaO (DUF488 family)